MAEKIGTIYYDLDLDDSQYQRKTSAASRDAQSFGDKIQGASLQLAAMGATAGIALTQVYQGIRRVVDAAVKQQNALMGLSSIAQAFGEDANEAKAAARQLADDGLMPIGDAASSLKNLLASGFSLPQAIKLMNAFKDSAAFGRQGSLEFGQAIVGATEGIKNGNSILVDNAGITKNLSNILTEAGYSAQDLSKASSDAGVRQAIFNGILKEANPMMGDAAKLSESFGGAQARLGTQITLLSVALGEALQPILSKIIDVISPLIEKFMNFAKNNPAIIAAIVAFTVVLLSLVTVLGLVGAAVGFIMSAGLGTIAATAMGIVAGIAVLIGALVFLETKFGLVSKAVDVVKGALSAVGQKVTEVFNAIANNSAIQWLVNFISGTFKDIWSDLQGIFNQLKQSLEPVFDALGKVFSAIGDFVSKHGDKFLTVLKVIGIALGAIVLAPLIAAFGAFLAAIKLISVVLGFVNEHFETIKKVVLTILAVAFAPLIAAVGLVVLAFKAVVWVVQQIWTVFTFVFNAIWLLIQFVFNGIMLLWNTILKPVFTAIVFIITSLFKIWSTIWTGIFQVVWTIVSTIAQIIFVILQGIFNFIVNTILRPVFNFFKAIFTAIWNVVSSVFNAVWGVISSILGAIWGVIRSVFNSVLGFVRSVFNWIKDAIISPIRSAYNAIAGVVGSIKDTVVGGIRNAINAVGNFVGDAVNKGRDLINGIVRGVGNAKDAVVNKVKEICSGALDAVKSFFGISSPSKVMAEMGGYMMDGMQRGIERAGGAVVSAATQISDKISEGMQDSLKSVSDGADNVVGVYRGMYGQLGAMNMASAASLNGTVSAINAAANEQNGGAIAQPPVQVTVAPQGIIARSRAELREITGDMIESVNEDLRSRGYEEIGNGKVTGRSTAS